LQRPFSISVRAMDSSDVTDERTPWDDPFRTLLSACEKQWAIALPQYAVSKWMGHSLQSSR
jgi:hypothetical protein